MNDQTKSETSETSDNVDILGKAFSDDASHEDILGSLVGEGKKFRTVEDLARSKYETDRFIDKIKDENKQLRDLVESLDGKVKTQSTLDEILERVSSSSVQRKPGDPASRDNSSSDNLGGNQPVGLTREDVVNLLSERDANLRAKQNREAVNAKLGEMFGDSAPDKIRNRSKELGLSERALLNLAETSPKAFIALIDNSAEGKGTSRTTGRSTMNTEAIERGNLVNHEVRNQAYYDKMKQQMGVKAFLMDTKVQVQLHKDMNRLGDAFFE